MTAHSLHEAIDTSDCKVWGCANVARTMRGRYARLCDEHAKEQSQRPGAAALQSVTPHVPRAVVLTPVHLAPAELRVLQAAARGLTIAETGAGLFTSAETVKSQRKQINAKLGAANITHAVALAYERGILERGSLWKELAA